MLNDEIEQVLQPLLGLSIWDSTRASNLYMFDIGPERIVTNRLGKQITLGEYGLHVSCAWRIRNSNHIIAGSDDQYSRDDDSVLPNDQILDTTPLETKMRMFWKIHRNDKLCIQSIEADCVGGIALDLSKGFILDIFPNASDDEYWRLVPPSDDDNHIVMTATGLNIS